VEGTVTTRSGYPTDREDHDLLKAELTDTFSRRRCNTMEERHWGKYFTNNLKLEATP